MIFERFFSPKERDRKYAIWKMAEKSMEAIGGVGLLEDLRIRLTSHGLSCSDVEESTDAGNPFEKKVRLYWGLKREGSQERPMWESRGVEIAVSHRGEIAVRCTYQEGWVNVEKTEGFQAFEERRNRWASGEWVGQEVPRPSLSWRIDIAAEVAEYIKDRRFEKRSGGTPALVKGWRRASS